MGIRSLGGYDKPGSEGISYAAVWDETGTGAMDPSAIPYPDGTGKWYGSRGVFAGGSTPGGFQLLLDYVTIASTANAGTFGNLNSPARTQNGGASNGTRGVFGSGWDGSVNGQIDYITFASTGNATDFGDLYDPRRGAGACCDGVRVVWAGGYNGSGYSATHDYITIDTAGDAAFFGNGTNSDYTTGACSNKTYGLWFGGISLDNTIKYVTIATLGNSVVWGYNIGSSGYGMMACSSSANRACATGGAGPNAEEIHYLEITTPGNASVFGDTTQARKIGAGCSDGSRGIFGGGDDGGTKKNIIDYITIGSTGDATDFGDLQDATNDLAAAGGT